MSGILWAFGFGCLLSGEPQMITIPAEVSRGFTAQAKKECANELRAMGEAYVRMGLTVPGTPTEFAEEYLHLNDVPKTTPVSVAEIRQSIEQLRLQSQGQERYLAGIPSQYRNTFQNLDTVAVICINRVYIATTEAYLAAPRPSDPSRPAIQTPAPTPTPTPTRAPDSVPPPPPSPPLAGPPRVPPTTRPASADPALESLVKELGNACSGQRDAAVQWTRRASQIDVVRAGTPESLDQTYEYVAGRDRAATLSYRANWDKGVPNPLTAFHLCAADARLRQLGRAPEFTNPAPAVGTRAKSSERVVECRALAAERKLQGPPLQEYLDDCTAVNSLVKPPAVETPAQITARGRALIAELRPSCEKDRSQLIAYHMGVRQISKEEAAATVDRITDAWADLLATEPEGALARLRAQATSRGDFYSACVFGERMKQVK